MKQKGELDRRVARELRMKSADVARVTTEFIRQVSYLLAEAGFVTIDGLGSLKVVVYRPAQWMVLTGGNFKKRVRRKVSKVEVMSYLRVQFSKSTKLKELLNESFKEQ